MKIAIVWLRNNLRIHDNPIFNIIEEIGDFDHVIPICIVNKEKLEKTYTHNRIRFLYQSILDLKTTFKSKYNVNLLSFSGSVIEIFSLLISSLESDSIEIYCDYCTRPETISENLEIKDLIHDMNDVNFTIVDAVNTILNIEEVISSDYYSNPKSMKDMQHIFEKTFGKYLDFFNVPKPLTPVINIPQINMSVKNLLDEKLFEFLMSDIILKGEIKKFSTTVDYFPGGETEAVSRLRQKITENPDYVNNFSKPSTYSTNENQNPLEPSTTGLSPYLSNGCLSPRLLWQECVNANKKGEHTKPPVSLIGQLMFREMFYLLSRSVDNWDSDIGNSNCKYIEWDEYNEEKITLWEEGKTGFPLIDAMMRQLEVTGWMHHLGRHAVSCFLTRGQLWQNWKYGREVFDRKLIDSDWAVNNGNWLWLAGVAPFSMPYYRIYNPCPSAGTSLNVETKEAKFIRHWVPELRNFPSKYIFEPHLAPEQIQNDSGCIIGKDYPFPMVDRKISRKENLAKFKESLNRQK